MAANRQARPTGWRGWAAWLLRRRPAPDPALKPPVPIAVAGTQQDWLRVLPADALLQVVPAHKAITEMGRISRFSNPVFERDCLEPLRRYAEFVQLMPASEAHHHAHAGGLLAHTIEMVLASLHGRVGHLLPENARIETIDAQRDEWTLVVFYAALLHDIAKPLTDLRITWRAKNLEAVRWMPLAGSLVDLAQGRVQAEYLVAFTAKAERDYSAHSRTSLLLLQRMASPTALAILARQPSVFEALNRYLAGQDKDSLLAQIVRHADKASVQRALASGSRARFATAQSVPLVDLLMQALKTMLRNGTALPLNRSGAAGWVHDGALWLVAKRAADATREWINKHEPDETVPGETKHDRLFDTWQEYGCIVPNPYTGQAIWYVTVHGRGTEAGQNQDAEELEQGAYDHSLSVLRFPLEKLFDDPNQYPPPMLGTIEVHDKRSKKEAAEEQEESEADDQSEGATDGVQNSAAAQAAPVRRADVQARAQKASKPAPPSAPPSAPAIRAPTFFINKPKPVTPAPAAKLASVPAPKPAPATVSAVSKTAAAAVVEDDDDDAAYLLDPEDCADPQTLKREREQRLLAKTAKQARKVRAQTGTAPAPAMPATTQPTRPIVAAANVAQAPHWMVL
ncbi:MAG: TraI domain-containing protein, partial [Burkholderiaceae bacterium]|nr:TraI domain-containing protein [Burkholderiaceae bacterium]